MTPTVRWFRNRHEHRNNWLRFGLMRLHRAGKILYKEEGLEACVSAGFDESLVRHEHRHTSLIAVESGTTRVRCIVDSEDSFLCMTGIIGQADVYFCAGYNAAFFREGRFEPPYPWLEPHETAFYHQRARDIIETQGAFFNRVRPFVPIGPELALRCPPGHLSQRLRNLHNKVSRRLPNGEPWRFELVDFEQRYRDLLALRDRSAQHDVVLLDTLWGWPRHRLALHQRLGELATSGCDIHSRLNWAEPSHWDGSDVAPFPHEGFPIINGKVANYEEMLASSRLAVFASGFHWGWRNIMTLALMWGLPILADRLLLEPWFPMDRFIMNWNVDADWQTLGELLYRVSDEERARIASHNQAAFDALLAPDKVAEYFLQVAVG